MLRIILVFVSLFLLPLRHATAADNIFTYAGLSANTTMQELRQRYPTSTFQGNYVKLSEKDSHDYITSVSLTMTAQYSDMRIGFGRELPGKPDKSRSFIYPPCQEIYNTLKQQYGKDKGLFDYHEEMARNRRFTWKLKNEELNLGCFKSEDHFVAEYVRITSSKH